MAAHAYDVYLHDEHIDTVFFCDADATDEVKRGLIHHDGYDPAIIVREAAKADGQYEPEDL